MARPVKRSLEHFPTGTKLLYDTRIKALRRSYKEDGNANNAFFVFDHLFREIFGNEGYYIEYNTNLIGDTADFCYVAESFVTNVIQRCIELDLFDKEQFERNKILTSRAIQNKYRNVFVAMKRTAEIEGRLYVPNKIVSSENSGVSSEETPVFAEETPENLEETPCNKRKEIKERKETNKRNAGDVFYPFDPNSPVMERVRSVIEDDALREAIRNWIRFMFDEKKILDAISIDLHLKDLLSFSSDPKKQLEIVNESVKCRWKRFVRPDDKAKDKNADKRSKFGNPEDAKKGAFG